MRFLQELALGTVEVFIAAGLILAATLTAIGFVWVIVKVVS